MCGIFGYRGDEPDRLVRRMGEALRHRGPDGEGGFTAPPFAVGMTRLAILDREGGQQPFRSEDGQIQVVCNGEIYNWKELRSELEARGHVFHTRCDCEVLPHAWEEWGQGMFSRLNGMFAIALHEAGTQRLILARDRYGQKPLYYTGAGEGFVFASEIRALFAAGTPAGFDPAPLHTYLMLRYVPEPETLFEGVRILPAGHVLELSAETGTGPSLRRWHDDSPMPEFSGTPGEALEHLDQLLHEATGRSLQSDVPVAVYLSGGVDSSLLAHGIKESEAAPHAFSLGFPGPRDESKLAGDWARTLGLPFTRVECGPEALRELPRVVGQMELPVGDALVVAFDQLAVAAADAGCKVALGGEGADELFGGYSFHRILRTAERLGRGGRAAAAGALHVLPAGLLDRLSPFPAELGAAGRAKVVRYLRGYESASPWWRGVGLRSLFEPREVEALLDPDHLHEWPSREPGFDLSGELVESHLRDQFRGWMQDWSLIRQERNGMAHSLEFRAPFLDHPLADFAGSLPVDWKLRGGGKWIWRRLAARSLPREIVERPKIPFYFPLETFTEDTAFREMVHDHLSPGRVRQRGLFQPAAVENLLEKAFCSGEFLPLKQVASLLILELWFDSFSPCP